jgi:hypothetical protein
MSHISHISTAQRLDKSRQPSSPSPPNNQQRNPFPISLHSLFHSSPLQATGTFQALAPSGASTGVHEALELQDTSLPAHEGKSVVTAVQSVIEIIALALIAKKLDVEKDQKKIDALLCELDGTKGKKLGANAILGISMAVARTGAAVSFVFPPSVVMNRGVYSWEIDEGD